MENENRPSPVCISVKKFLEMEEKIKELEKDVYYWKDSYDKLVQLDNEQIVSLERNLTFLDLDNQKYKDMCREHYEEMLKQEKKANQLEIDLEYLRKLIKELNKHNEALILENLTLKSKR